MKRSSFFQEKGRVPDSRPLVMACDNCGPCCAKGETGMVWDLYIMFLAFIAMMINVVTAIIVIVKKDDLWTGISIFGAAIACLNIFFFAGSDYLKRKSAIGDT